MAKRSGDDCRLKELLTGAARVMPLHRGTTRASTRVDQDAERAGGNVDQSFTAVSMAKNIGKAG